MDRPKVALFTTWQWLTIIGAVVVTGSSVTVFAFNTFSLKSDIESRLSRIENKLDDIQNVLIRRRNHGTD